MSSATISRTGWGENNPYCSPLANPWGLEESKIGTLFKNLVSEACQPLFAAPFLNGTPEKLRVPEPAIPSDLFQFTAANFGPMPGKHGNSIEDLEATAKGFAPTKQRKAYEIKFSEAQEAYAVVHKILFEKADEAQSKIDGATSNSENARNVFKVAALVQFVAFILMWTGVITGATTALALIFFVPAALATCYCVGVQARLEDAIIAPDKLTKPETTVEEYKEETDLGLASTRQTALAAFQSNDLISLAKSNWSEQEIWDYNLFNYDNESKSLEAIRQIHAIRHINAQATNFRKSIADSSQEAQRCFTELSQTRKEQRSEAEKAAQAIDQKKAGDFSTSLSVLANLDIKVTYLKFTTDRLRERLEERLTTISENELKGIIDPENFQELRF